MNITDEMAFLLEKYIDRTITSDEADQFILLLDQSEEFNEMFRTNVLSDFFLRLNVETPPAIHAKVTKKPTMKHKKTSSISPVPELETGWQPHPITRERTRKKELEQKQKAEKEQATADSIKPVKTVFSKRSNWFFVLTCCLAVYLIIQVSYFEYHHGSFSTPKEECSPFTSFARITETIDAVWEPGQPEYKRGQWLEPAVPLFLKSGYVKVTMDTGTEFILEGPTHIVPTNSKTISCSKGKISATVPPKGVGFEILTSLGKVIDYGTAFALTIDEQANRLDVVEGRVGIITASSPEPIIFNKNESASLNQKNIIDRISAEPFRFLTDNRFLAMLRKYVQKVENVRHKQELALDNHPNLLVRFDFQNDYKDQVPNLSSRGQALCPSLTTVLCRKGEGSLPEHFSLQLRNRESRGKFSISGNYPSTTLCMRVRIDSLPNAANTLFTSDSYPIEAGSFVWQIHNTGELALLIKPKAEKEYQNFQSPSIFNRRMLGTWVDLAVVLDAQRQKITHYINGHSVAVLPWKERIIPVLEHVSIGNYSGNYRGMTEHNLVGAVENFYLFDRALTSKEIADLAQ